jgi:hypothetical protein
MTSLITLDLYSCTKHQYMPVNSAMGSLIFLDLSFCNISIVPDAIGELRGLERLNLQGNNFIRLPSTIQRLYSLAYLNLSHCHKLQHLPSAPTKSGPSDSVGRYFKTTSGSRDHRSGLYVFDCLKMDGSMWRSSRDHQYEWLQRLFKVCTVPPSLFVYSDSNVCVCFLMIYCWNSNVSG